jgi:ribosomal protein S18 acetylase RimI-like enzyme
MLKRYSQFIKESLTFDEETDDERVTINAYVNGKFIGKVVVVYEISGYWEFEDEMSEERYDELFPGDRFAKIEYITVATEYTGKGYAKALMNKALEHIKESGETRVYLNASPMGHNEMDLYDLVNFYKKFGFEIIIDDYDENKEMLLKLESTSTTIPEQTLRNIDAYVQMHGDEEKRKEAERIYREEDEEEDIIHDEFDEDTPEIPTQDIEEPSMRKNVSLGYGKTNMP